VANDARGEIDRAEYEEKRSRPLGLIIFWPALLFTKGNDENTAD
jgi:hypothetical protein